MAKWRSLGFLLLLFLVWTHFTQPSVIFTSLLADRTRAVIFYAVLTAVSIALLFSGRRTLCVDPTGKAVFITGRSFYSIPRTNIISTLYVNFIVGTKLLITTYIFQPNNTSIQILNKCHKDEYNHGFKVFCF